MASYNRYAQAMNYASTWIESYSQLQTASVTEEDETTRRLGLPVFVHAYERSYTTSPNCEEGMNGDKRCFQPHNFCYLKANKDSVTFGVFDATEHLKLKAQRNIPKQSLQQWLKHSAQG